MKLSCVSTAAFAQTQVSKVIPFNETSIHVKQRFKYSAYRSHCAKPPTFILHNDLFLSPTEKRFQTSFPHVSKIVKGWGFFFFILCIIKHNSQPPLEPIIDWDKWSYLKKKSLMKSLRCLWNSAVKINEKQFLDIHYFKLQIAALMLLSRFIEFS